MGALLFRAQDWEWLTCEMTSKNMQKWEGKGNNAALPQSTGGRNFITKRRLGAQVPDGSSSPSPRYLPKQPWAGRREPHPSTGPALPSRLPAHLAQLPGDRMKKRTAPPQAVPLWLRLRASSLSTCPSSPDSFLLWFHWETDRAWQTHPTHPHPPKLRLPLVGWRHWHWRDPQDNHGPWALEERVGSAISGHIPSILSSGPGVSTGEEVCLARSLSGLSQSPDRHPWTHSLSPPQYPARPGPSGQSFSFGCQSGPQSPDLKMRVTETILGSPTHAPSLRGRRRWWPWDVRAVGQGGEQGWRETGTHIPSRGRCPKHELSEGKESQGAASRENERGPGRAWSRGGFHTTLTLLSLHPGTLKMAGGGPLCRCWPLVCTSASGWPRATAGRCPSCYKQVGDEGGQGLLSLTRSVTTISSGVTCVCGR